MTRAVRLYGEDLLMHCVSCHCAGRSCRLGCGRPSMLRVSSHGLRRRTHLDVLLQLPGGEGRDLARAPLRGPDGGRDDRRPRPPVPALGHRHVHPVDHVPYPLALRKRTMICDRMLAVVRYGRILQMSPQRLRTDA